MFTYTRPLSGYSVTWGQSFQQRAAREEADGTFTLFTRSIRVRCPNPIENKVPAFTKTAVNVSREDARKFVQRWLDAGYSRAATAEFCLEDADEQQAEIEARVAARLNRKV